MTIIRHTITSTGLRQGAFVQLTEACYATFGVPTPLHRPVFMITGIHSVDGAFENVTLMWNKGEESGYFVCDPHNLEAI